ncbi:uncharacterized protein BKA78DRAFT_182671 [Phyllosticta capitalensis]|uniref:uncharacterized protein n=1 Tax=Phyllosticta capitalensis TaxID=121624 RepID=UPI003132590D
MVVVVVVVTHQTRRLLCSIVSLTPSTCLPTYPATLLAACRRVFSLHPRTSVRACMDGMGGAHCSTGPALQLSISLTSSRPTHKPLPLLSFFSSPSSSSCSSSSSIPLSAPPSTPQRLLHVGNDGWWWQGAKHDLPGTHTHKHKRRPTVSLLSIDLSAGGEGVDGGERSRSVGQSVARSLSRSVESERQARRVRACVRRKERR